MNSAINSHKSELKAIRKELLALESRRQTDSDRDDDQLNKRIVELEGFHD
jgi:hypothetical protein